MFGRLFRWPRERPNLQGHERSHRGYLGGVWSQGDYLRGYSVGVVKNELSVCQRQDTIQECNLVFEWRAGGHGKRGCGWYQGKCPPKPDSLCRHWASDEILQGGGISSKLFDQARRQEIVALWEWHAIRFDWWMMSQPSIRAGFEEPILRLCHTEVKSKISRNFGGICKIYLIHYYIPWYIHVGCLAFTWTWFDLIYVVYNKHSREQRLLLIRVPVVVVVVVVHLSVLVLLKHSCRPHSKGISAGKFELIRYPWRQHGCIVRYGEPLAGLPWSSPMVLTIFIAVMVDKEVFDPLLAKICWHVGSAAAANGGIWQFKSGLFVFIVAVAALEITNNHLITWLMIGEMRKSFHGQGRPSNVTFISNPPCIRCKLRVESDQGFDEVLDSRLRILDDTSGDKNFFTFATKFIPRFCKFNSFVSNLKVSSKVFILHSVILWLEVFASSFLLVAVASNISSCKTDTENPFAKYWIGDPDALRWQVGSGSRGGHTDVVKGQKLLYMNEFILRTTRYQVPVSDKRILLLIPCQAVSVRLLMSTGVRWLDVPVVWGMSK